MSPARSATRRVVVALAVAVGLATTSAASAAADDVRIYEVPGGDPSMNVRATCSGTTCSVVPENTDAFYPGVWTEPLTVTDGRGELVLPDTCGTSDTDPYASHAQITLTVTMSDDELVATRAEKGGISRPRPDYTCRTKGFTVTQRLTLVTPDEPSPSTPPPPASTSAPAAAPPAGGAGAATTTSDGVVASADGPGGATVSRLASGEPDAPSVLSGLRTVAQVDARNVLVAALVTIVLVLLLAFPTSLLDSAVETGSDRLSAWWRRRRGLEDEDGDGVPWWWAAAGVLGAGVISSFVDPQFGLNLGSARTLVSVVVGVVVEVLLGWVVVWLVVRRAVPDARASFSFAPATLLLVAGAVVLTRVTGFEPGLVFGLVAGIGFATVAGSAAHARVTLVPLAVGAVVGLLAWAVYGLVDDTTGTWGTLAAETLSALAVAGLVALPLVLVPVPGLPGHEVFRWDRRVWAGCYAFGLFAFFVVLMPTPYAWDEVSWSLTAWVLVYLAYLAASVTAWWLVRRGQRRAAASRA